MSKNGGDMAKGRLSGMTFRSKQVAGLFGVSVRQLDYWVQTELITPSQLGSDGRGAIRFFSFVDLIQIRTIKALLDGGMSIQKIRKSVSFLKETGLEFPLTARLITDGETIFKVVKNNKELLHAIDTLKYQGQGVFFVPIGELVEEVEKKVTTMRKVA